jgi:hypothetical protein
VSLGGTGGPPPRSARARALCAFSANSSTAIEIPRPGLTSRRCWLRGPAITEIASPILRDRHRFIAEATSSDLSVRPRGRPSYAPLVRYRSFAYQAASWDRPRRVIAKIEHHLGELFPRVGFIVTTLTGTNRAVIRFYNQRGTAEQWIKEGKEATHWTRLSCHRFRANEVRLLLGVIAYNLGNLLRRLVLPVAIQSWSLTSLQQRLFKTGARLVRHARCFTLQLAESYLTGSLFRQILQRIERLAWHPT